MATEKNWHVELDARGWPASLPAPERTWLTEAVAEAIRAAGKPLSLHLVTSIVRDRARRQDQCATFCSYATWDAIYCTVERALRAADASPVWTLERAP